MKFKPCICHYFTLRITILHKRFVNHLLEREPEALSVQILSWTMLVRIILMFKSQSFLKDNILLTIRRHMSKSKMIRLLWELAVDLHQSMNSSLSLKPERECMRLWLTVNQLDPLQALRKRVRERNLHLVKSKEELLTQNNLAMNNYNLALSSHIIHSLVSHMFQILWAHHWLTLVINKMFT